jgi:hypothetical protein
MLLTTAVPLDFFAGFGAVGQGTQENVGLR